MDAILENNHINIIEKKAATGPITINLSFIQKDGARHYKESHIRNVVMECNKLITKYFASLASAYIMEKKNPTLIKDDVYIDDVRIIYPYMCVKTSLQEKILSELIMVIDTNNFFEDIKETNPFWIIKSYVDRESEWPVYLSYVDDTCHELTRIYDCNNKFSLMVTHQCAPTSKLADQTLANIIRLLSVSYSSYVSQKNEILYKTILLMREEMYDNDARQMIKISAINRCIWYEFVNHKWEKVEKKTDPFAIEYCSKNIAQIAKNKLKCTSIDGNTPYKFVGHRWVKQNRVSAYEFLITNCAHKYLEMMNPRYIMDKIMIVEDCLRILYDPDFESKLDTDTNLVGFNDGVYDLYKSEFRAGYPDDCISMSTCYDYESYDPTSEIAKQINTFFSKLQTDVKVKEYLSYLLSMCLEGLKMSYVFYGKKNNGKTSLLLLLKHSFGDYYTKSFHKKGVKVVSFEESDSDIFLDQTNTACSTIYECNKLPYVEDVEKIKDITIIPFFSQFTSSHNDHPEKQMFAAQMIPVEKWKATFMSILIESHKKYKTMCELLPAVIVEATTNYRTMCTKERISNPYELPKLIDSYGKICVDNEAELAVMLYDKSCDEPIKLNRIYFNSRQLIRIVIDCAISGKHFKRGIYIEIPQDKKNYCKIIRHMLIKEQKMIELDMDQFY